MFFSLLHFILCFFPFAFDLFVVVIFQKFAGKCQGNDQIGPVEQSCFLMPSYAAFPFSFKINFLAVASSFATAETSFPVAATSFLAVVNIFPWQP